MLEMSTHFDTLVYFVIGAGIFMAIGIGANDFSNAAGPAVGGKVLGLISALVIVAAFEFVGAMFHSTEVTDTIRTSIVDIDRLSDQSATIFYGMLSALLAAASWLMIASGMGWPVSTTHSIIGALVGFSIAGIGLDAILWSNVSNIVLGWIFSPLLGGVVAYLLMKSIFVLILQSATPVKAAKRWGPVYVIIAGFVVSLALLFKGMTFFTFSLVEMDLQESLVIAFMTGSVISMIGLFSFISLQVDKVEHAFYPMILFTVCVMAFAHGANDVANAIGPMAVALDVLESSGQGLAEIMTVSQMYVVGAVGIIFGMLLLGYKVMYTVGSRITKLSPCRAFSASLTTAGTVVAASTMGLPVSTTHILIGAVLGVGLAESRQKVQWRTVQTIIIAWLITIPVVSVLAALIFLLISTISSTP